MASERDLTMAKARQMTREALAAELLRCKDGIQVAANQAAKRRFKMRFEIMEQELLDRLEAEARKGRQL